MTTWPRKSEVKRRGTDWGLCVVFFTYTYLTGRDKRKQVLSVRSWIRSDRMIGSLSLSLSLSHTHTHTHTHTHIHMLTATEYMTTYFQQISGIYLPKSQTYWRLSSQQQQCLFLLVFFSVLSYPAPTKVTNNDHHSFIIITTLTLKYTTQATDCNSHPAELGFPIAKHAPTSPHILLYM